MRVLFTCRSPKSGLLQMEPLHKFVFCKNWLNYWATIREILLHKRSEWWRLFPNVCFCPGSVYDAPTALSALPVSFFFWVNWLLKTKTLGEVSLCLASFVSLSRNVIVFISGSCNVSRVPLIFAPYCTSFDPNISPATYLLLYLLSPSVSEIIRPKSAKFHSFTQSSRCCERCL